jgi:hypothetical protein
MSLCVGWSLTGDRKSAWKVFVSRYSLLINAKDHEQHSLGRSPGCWLQTHLISPSHSISDSGFPPETEVMSCLPVTVARLRRTYTDFPIMPEQGSSGHPVRMLDVVINVYSIPIASSQCQIVDIVILYPSLKGALFRNWELSLNTGNAKSTLSQRYNIKIALV